MAAFPTTIWAKRAGLVTGAKQWEIEFRLLASGKMPKAASTSNRSTELWMRIARDHYWVDIQHGGKRLSVMRPRGYRVQRPYRELALPDPPIAGFGEWLADAEASFGKQFRRDKLWVKSNVAGGRDAVVKWIESGFAF